MTDLTVLISPLPLYPASSSEFLFARNKPLARPIMVTLESEIDVDSPSASGSSSQSRFGPDPDGSAHSAPGWGSGSGSTSQSGSDSRSPSPISPKNLFFSEPDFTHPPPSPRRTSSRTPRIVEPHLLSPPVNTWKSRPRPRHRVTRSQSAPPERREPLIKGFSTPRSPAPQEYEDQDQRPVGQDQRQGQRQPFNTDALGFRPRQRHPNRSFTSFSGGSGGVSSTVDGQSTRGGELVRPAPPLLRPSPFWRRLPRSALTSPAYSPSSHLVRRSTYIAAGLQFETPGHDLSALCVESRVVGVVVGPEGGFA